MFSKIVVLLVKHIFFKGILAKNAFFFKKDRNFRGNRLPPEARGSAANQGSGGTAAVSAEIAQITRLAINMIMAVAWAVAPRRKNICFSLFYRFSL